jgi:hypothetical protein
MLLLLYHVCELVMFRITTTTVLGLCTCDSHSRGLEMYDLNCSCSLDNDSEMWSKYRVAILYDYKRKETANKTYYIGKVRVLVQLFVTTVL